VDYTDDARLPQTIVDMEYIVISVSRYQQLGKILRECSSGNFSGPDSFESRFQPIPVPAKGFDTPFA